MHTKKFKLLQDVLFYKNETTMPVKTYIVSTMQGKKENVYLVAGINHLVKEGELLIIKKYEIKN
jgi:hypothetical protein